VGAPTRLRVATAWRAERAACILELSVCCANKGGREVHGAAGRDAESRPVCSSIPRLVLGSLQTRTVTGATKPAHTKEGPAWPARILQAGVNYHRKQEVVYVGLDIAKAYLDLAFEKQTQRFANNSTGRSDLLHWLHLHVSAPVHVIAEASGGYERASERPNSSKQGGGGEFNPGHSSPPFRPRRGHFGQN
jgi:hypothetical protein